MPLVTVKLETAVRRTFRVEQVAGMFDVPIEQRLKHELTAEVPGLDEPWTIGAIVGPSGSGKTTLARAAFGKAIYKPRAWPKDRAIVDVLGCGAGVPPAAEMNGRRDAFPTIKEITRVLVAVGLGSPPAWLKPYHVLSTGERFRADLARCLLAAGRNLTQRRRGAEDEHRHSLCASAPLREHSLLVVDEFTGALDRTIAKTTSAALARLLRTPGSPIRFVAVTCHRDILPWLAPDWILDLGARTAGQASSGTQSSILTRQRPAKPRLKLVFDRVPQAMWTQFAGHHYLAGGLAASATCYAALWNREPLAFCAVVAVLGQRRMKRIQRLVTLPAFQGMGLGGRLLDLVAGAESQRGFRVTITASHPAILAHCSRSRRWRLVDVKKHGSTRQTFDGREVPSSAGRAVAAFEFVGAEG